MRSRSSFCRPVISASAMTSAITAASGTYVSSVFPAADAPGMVMVMTLYPNNAAEETTIYFGKDAIMEVGSWELGFSESSPSLWQSSAHATAEAIGLMCPRPPPSCVAILTATGSPRWPMPSVSSGL